MIQKRNLINFCYKIQYHFTRSISNYGRCLVPSSALCTSIIWRAQNMFFYLAFRKL